MVRYPVGPIVTVFALMTPAANDAAKNASGAKDLPIFCIYEKFLRIRAAIRTSPLYMECVKCEDNYKRIFTAGFYFSSPTPASRRAAAGRLPETASPLSKVD